MRWIIALIAVIAIVVVGLLVFGGDSKSEKAMAQVCDARADIAKQVDSLKSLTPATATTSEVGSSLQAIRTDLSKIADARGDLASENRDKVKAANEAFVVSVRETLSTVARTTSASDAAAQLQAAVQKLAASYQDTFGTIDCG